jgi:Phage integrase family/Family of unknown function (DUF5372)
VCICLVLAKLDFVKDVEPAGCGNSIWFTYKRSARAQDAGRSQSAARPSTRNEPSEQRVPRVRWRELSIAPPASGEAQTFRVTHPFHPLRGRTFQLVDCRQTWGEDRVYFYDDSGHLARLPLQWTDVVALYHERVPECAFVFPHSKGRKAGEPVRDVKNAFHTALTTAKISDFTWHDLRHTFASWLMMKGGSLRAVAELLGHRGLRMVMRYAHPSPAYLMAEVGLLDPPPPRNRQRAKKGQRVRRPQTSGAKGVKFPRGNGSSGWTRTSNPPVNRLMQV